MTTGHRYPTDTSAPFYSDVVPRTTGLTCCNCDAFITRKTHDHNTARYRVTTIILHWREVIKLSEINKKKTRDENFKIFSSSSSLSSSGCCYYFRTVRLRKKKKFSAGDTVVAAVALAADIRRL